jgi:Tannase and feruloyl esterase
MNRRSGLRALMISVTVATLAGCGGGGSGGTSTALNCSDVTTAKLNLSGLVVTTSVANAASGAASSAASYPAHCQVTGTINQRTGIDGKTYAIGFDIRLPATGWNGKFFYSGDAGIDGGFNDPLGSTAVGGTTNAVTLGYAVASSDGGHSSSGLDGSFGLDPQARVDYGYNALGTLAPLAKNIVGEFYGTPATRSYYAGCSKGGQSGMVAAARFADQFDGIVAGDPGFNLPKAAVEELYDNQQFATVNANITQAFSPADLALVSTSILAKCDALDGAADGMVNDVAACKAAFNFATDVPQCASGVAPDGTCLSATQKTALANIFAGAKGTSGDLLYSDWPWDPGIAGSNWTFWKTFLNAQIAPVAMGNVFATPPAPVIAAFSPATTAYWQAFDVNGGFELIYGTNAAFTESSMSFMTPPNPNHLTTLKAKSKLIVYHGTGDPVFSSNDTTNWYNNLRAADASAASYARLFLVPGMNHCGGGPATDNFDMLTALVSWVEQGTAPDTVKATVATGNADKPAAWSASRSRPLCAYPKKAVLVSGAADLESASSFSCQ